MPSQYRVRLERPSLHLILQMYVSIRRRWLWLLFCMFFLVFFHLLIQLKWKIYTVKSQAVDRFTIQFLTIFGVLLTKTCYYPRRATISWVHLLFLPVCRILKNSDQIFSQSLFMKMHLHEKKKDFKQPFMYSSVDWLLDMAIVARLG